MVEQLDLDSRLLAWWGSLSARQMKRAREIAQTGTRTLDEDTLASLLRGKQPVAAAHWVSGGEGPKFRMPEAIADFINNRPDRSSWSGVGPIEAAAEKAALHFGHSNFHLVEQSGKASGETSWTFVEGER